MLYQEDGIQWATKKYDEMFDILFYLFAILNLIIS